MKAFTERYIQSLKPKNERYEIAESNRSGLRIKVFPNATRSWVFRYKIDGKQNRMTLGQYPTMKIKDAHAEVGRLRGLLNSGIDPAHEERIKREETIMAPTVQQLSHEYIERHAKTRKKSWKRDQDILNRDVIPRIGYRKARDIRRRDIVAILDQIVDRGAPIAANRAFEVIRKMFNFAIERDILESSPCHMVRAPSGETQRDRILTPDEVFEFWHGLTDTAISKPVQLATKFVLVSAQRKGEVINSEWKEFDLETGWWTIPGERAKNKMSHRVPLSKMALELLEEIKTYPIDSEYLFPSPAADKPILDTAVDRAIRRNRERLRIEHFTPHDLRRTAASHMTSIGISRLVVSKILNHSESGITAVYDRHSYDKEKRQALDAWCGRLSEILAGESNVIKLPKVNQL